MKRILITLSVFISVFMLSGQENKINRIPTVGEDINQHQYSMDDRGIWYATEMLTGYSSQLGGRNMGLSEFDVTLGYRFNQFLKVGGGLGIRYYISQKDIRRHSSPLGMPLFLSLRGSVIPTWYRNIVPYWGFEFGGSVRDGAMFRPTIGLRIGQPRHSFTIGLTYMGQHIAASNNEGYKTGRYMSFFCIRVGYEF